MRKLATVETILEKKPIEGADKIEAVRVREWWVVAKKDEFVVGDACVYFEIDSFLPIIPPFEFLLKGSSKKRMIIDGQQVEGIRLKTIKLRGQISQGLVVDLANLTLYSKRPLSEVAPGDDVTEDLGVLKYEQPLPAELSGVAKGFFPGFLPKTDEERIQNMAGVLSAFYITEKLDGTSTSFYKKDGVFGVCSRNLELVEGDTTQWRIAKQYDLANKLPDGMAIQCELIGEGIQQNPLKQKGQDIYCFNVYNIEKKVYLDYQNMIFFCESIGVKTVPIIYDKFRLPETVEEVLELAEGKSKLNENEEREGIVIRPKYEMQYHGARFSFKAISNRYLLKEGE